MKHILAASNLEILRQFASSNVLLGFDYDGTLAPIVDRPEDARMRARTRELLAAVTRLYPCAVVSGRAQTDVLRRLRGVGVLEAIGNHGLEPSHYSQAAAREVQRWLPLLEPRLAGLDGVIIEDKIFSLALHYRQSREKRRARAAIMAAASALEGVRVIGGKLVVNLLPEKAPHKGLALLAARDRFSCDTALYVGDDQTDEDVFAIEEPGRLLTIRVEPSKASHASYFLKNQDEIDPFLETLIQCRREGRGPDRERRAAA